MTEISSHAYPERVYMRFDNDIYAHLVRTEGTPPHSDPTVSRLWYAILGALVGVFPWVFSARCAMLTASWRIMTAWDFGLM